MRKKRKPSKRKYIPRRRTANRNYDDPIYKEARLRVLKRDKFCCQMPKCGSKKKQQVHHIVEWSKAASLRYSERNMICLCGTCHDKIKGKEWAYVALFKSIVSRKYQ